MLLTNLIVIKLAQLCQTDDIDHFVRLTAITISRKERWNDETCRQKVSSWKLASVTLMFLCFYRWWQTSHLCNGSHSVKIETRRSWSCPVSECTIKRCYIKQSQCSTIWPLEEADWSDATRIRQRRPNLLYLIAPKNRETASDETVRLLLSVNRKRFKPDLQIWSINMSFWTTTALGTVNAFLFDTSHVNSNFIATWKVWWWPFGRSPL